MSSFNNKLNIKVFFPNYNSGGGVSHTFSSICKNMQSKNVKVTMYCYAYSKSKNKPSFIKDLIPFNIKSSFYRSDTKLEVIPKFAEIEMLKKIKKNDILYTYPGASLDFYKKVKEKGNMIITEMINTAQPSYRYYVKKAYRYLGWPLPKFKKSDEKEQLKLSDFIFAPSPLVKQSLIDGGIPENKILSSSYGWEPNRFKSKDRLDNYKGLTFLFLGSLCVRKGIPLLLKIWFKAKIKGRLILVGKIEKDVSKHCSDYFKRKNINHIDYTGDVASVLNSADVFVFPSHEEGSPLVGYEAMSQGLPMIVSPMGGGEIVRHNQDGFVLDPYNINEWVKIIRKLAKDKKLRKKMGESAKKRAKEFTWKKTGTRRRKQLIEAISKK